MAPDYSVIKVSDDNELLSHLINNIFHQTTFKAFESIKSDGCVKNNKDGSFQQSYSQSKTSFGNKNGYVCLFDFREIKTIDDPQIEKEILIRYNFMSDRITSNAYLILESKFHSEIIPNDQASTMKGDFMIPKYECWYKDKLPLEKIKKVLIYQHIV